MATNLVFNKGQGGLGRPLAGTDHISGMLFYSGATLPTGFTSSARVVKMYSLEDAENAGITNASLGETKSTATYLFTNKGAAGDTFKITVTSASGKTLTLASYTQVTADVTSTTTAASRLAAEINLLTYSHGFTASPSTATVTITAAAGQGVYLNTGTPYVVTVTGTIAGTLTQNVVTGVASDIDIMHYHISEFFRMQPKGVLYVGIYATADVGTFSNVTDMQNFAQGEIKQIGIYYKSTAFSTAHCTTLQAIYASLYTNNKPLEIILNAEISGTADVGSLTTLRSLTARNVSVCIGQDGDAAGLKLYNATGKSIGMVGTLLGSVALSKVQECIDWRGKFNIDNGVEFNTLAFANGQKYTAISDSLLSTLDIYGYIYGEKEQDVEGSFFNDSWTAVSQSDDYCYIEANRTINKSIRKMRFYLIPALGGNVYLNTDGTLREDSLAYYEQLCQRGLDEMKSAGELSDAKASIDPTQDILSSSNLEITVQELPVGVSRTITVNLGYVTKITN
jgi:hypothetical protein